MDCKQCGVAGLDSVTCRSRLTIIATAMSLHGRQHSVGFRSRASLIAVLLPVMWRAARGRDRGSRLALSDADADTGCIGIGWFSPRPGAAPRQGNPQGGSPSGGGPWPACGATQEKSPFRRRRLFARFTGRRAGPKRCVESPPLPSSPRWAGAACVASWGVGVPACRER